MLLRCVPLPKLGPPNLLAPIRQPSARRPWYVEAQTAVSHQSSFQSALRLSQHGFVESPPTILAVRDADFVMLWIISHNSDQTMLVFSPYHSDFFAVHDRRNPHRIESTESAALDNQRLKLSWVVAHTINFAIDNDLLADK